MLFKRFQSSLDTVLIKVFQSPLKSLDENWKLSRWKLLSIFVYLLTYPGVMMFIELNGSVLKIRAIVIGFYLLSDIWLPLSQLIQSSLNRVQQLQKIIIMDCKKILFLGVPWSWSARESRANGIKSISGKIIFFTLCPITRSGLSILRDAQHYHSFQHSNIQNTGFLFSTSDTNS